MKTNLFPKTLSALFAASALILSASVMAANPTPPDPGPGTGFQRGPDPSVSFLEADRGPYSVNTSRVSGLVSGFGGGTIHYPSGTTGTMAAIVVIPGYVSAESSIDWWGPKLASHGFVVMTIDTNTGFDQPPSRARQINSALDYLIGRNTATGSPVRGMIDTNRLGVIGWSMGGGGTLRVATEGRISAAIPLAPWDSSSLQFRNVQAPTMILACQSDVIAPVRNHASPFYDRLPSDLNKAFFELDGGNHYCANGGSAFGRYDAALSRLGVSWMKLHLDQDDRYTPFLCGPNHTSDSRISQYRGNCPY